MGQVCSLLLIVPGFLLSLAVTCPGTPYLRQHCRGGVGPACEPRILSEEGDSVSEGGCED